MSLSKWTWSVRRECRSYYNVRYHINDIDNMHVKHKLYITPRDCAYYVGNRDVNVLVKVGNGYVPIICDAKCCTYRRFVLWL